MRYDGVVVLRCCCGGGSDETVFDNDIFSVRRIKVAPVVCFLGFISIIYAIIKKPKDE